MNSFSFSQFLNRFPDDTTCLEEIKKVRFPAGIHCIICNKITKHYKLKGRTAYSCKICRNQVYPLKDTIFAKTSTPLRVWFYALFLMTHTRSDISIKQLQRELGVTYKTAWRMYANIHMLMEQNNGDLLVKPGWQERKWIFFNTIEFKVVQRSGK